MIFRAINVTALTLLSFSAMAAPSVTGNLISWPDDGWYQVQQVTDGGIVETCRGGRSCEVSSGEYIVINHSTGERFESVVVNDSSTAASPITVSGNILSWPDDGWYQVLDESNYLEVCSGGRSCALAPGSYLVVNHTRELRFEGIVVGSSDPISAIDVTGNTITWANDGWYQVLDQSTYSQVCGGTRSCDVTTGLYTVINHSTGTRWEDINVGRSMASTTRVNFDISVPAYQSDELLVKLGRSDKEVSATWNSDELWTVADDFPINSEETIKVTFYDRNGGIVLARFEQIVSTGTEVSESYAISAFQFNTDIDDDNDGVSNLDELIAGTDPLLAETRELPIRDAPFGGAWPNVLPDFESIGSIVERPYSVEEITPEGSDPFSSARSTLRRVTIDESGNGSFYYRKLLNRTDLQYIEEKIGNRTNTGHSILWDGSEYLFSESHRSSRDTHFTVEASRFDAQRLRIVATFNTEWLNEPMIGDSLHWTYDLVVTDVDDDGHCLPDSGTYVSTTTNLSESYTDSLMITKNPGDEYWHVLSTRNGVTLSEYLASWINMEVFCNYADFD